MVEQRSADLLAANILSNEDLLQAVKDDPKKVLPQQAKLATAATPLQTDRVIYRIVVSCLGAAVLLVASGLIFLASYKTGTIVPEGLIAMGSGALGALAGLLAPSPVTRG